VKIHIDAAIGYRLAGENAARIVSEAYPNAEEISIWVGRNGTEATIKEDGKWRKVDFERIMFFLLKKDEEK
jgi:hypothetical protein